MTQTVTGQTIARIGAGNVRIGVAERMPSLEHVTVLVGRRGVVTHPLLRNIVNLAADRVVEINPDGEPVYLERVL